MKNIFENIKLFFIIFGSIFILLSMLGITNLNIVTGMGLLLIAMPMFMSGFEMVMYYDFNFITILYVLAGSILTALGIFLI